MEKPFRNTWEIYTGKFEKLLLLMLGTTLPLLIVHSFVTNYMFAITPSISQTSSIADIYYGFLTVLLFIYAQVPFIRYVYNEYIGHEHSLRDSFIHFLSNGFTVFVFACIVSFLSTIGFMLFFLPGLIVLALVFPIPYLSVFDNKSVWKSFKEGIRIGKKNFFKILLVILVTGFVELFFGIYVTMQIFNITSSFSAQIITQMVLNMLFFPFVVILLTSYIIKWREAQEVLEVGVEEANF
ncbi:hypothetical protein QGM71_15715 [Virgibacillus sp. C22-A2]|uniref:DUF975 family protein n=1 Tax=Virgibacillus tibetensis TaxID=3042313 RepID=A0ABU6KHY4_9BACI|nr:hypothetical protein [Virgibacillus sp. C22-A2]